MDLQECVSVFFLLTVWRIFVTYACNLHQAELCASEQQRRCDAQRNSFKSDTSVTEETRSLCLSTLKEDNITQCYHDNTKPCAPDVMRFLTYQWQENENDTRRLCNKVCNNYEGLAECEKEILYQGLNDQWEAFCSSYNTSMICANKIVSKCKLDISFYEELIQREAKSQYKRICLTGCINLDETMEIIKDCWTKNGNGIKNQESTCQFHDQFLSCLYLPDKVCREVDDLVSLYYDIDNTTEECKRRKTTPIPTTQTAVTTQMETTTNVETTTEGTTAVRPELTSGASSAHTSAVTEALTTTADNTKQAGISTNTVAINVTTRRININTAVPSTSNSNRGRTTENHIQNGSDIFIRTCLLEKSENLTSMDEASIDLTHCSDIFTILACLYNHTSDTGPTRLSDLDIPTVLRKALTPDTLVTCSSRIQAQIQKTKSCSTGQDDEDDNTMCSGHTYGLIKCTNRRNGSSRLQTMSVILTATLLWLCTL